MALRRQLLRTQPISGDDLHRQRLRRQESGRVQFDLRYQSVIGNHHGDGSEEGLEVIGQFRPSRVTGIHGDEHGAGRVQLQFGPFEEQLLVAGIDTPLDGEDLLGDDREHLQVYAVELVEAGPSAARGQSLKLFGFNMILFFQSNVRETLKNFPRAR